MNPDLFPNPPCPHANVEFILTPEFVHYGMNKCKDCRVFLGWVAKPETVARLAENASVLESLKGKPLTEWERGFLLSLEKQGRHFSPKQQAVLDKLVAKYG